MAVLGSLHTSTDDISHALSQQWRLVANQFKADDVEGCLWTSASSADMLRGVYVINEKTVRAFTWM